MYCLWGMTALMIVASGRFKLSFLFTWFLFIGVVIAESIAHPFAVVYDVSVILCGALFCILVKGSQVNYRRIVKCLTVCGLIVSLCVIIDTSTGLFRVYLIDLYTNWAKSMKLGLQRSGGILLQTGSAGGYIYSGVAAYITLRRINGKGLKRIDCWIAIAMFGLSALMIGKRGFILDSALAILFIKVIQIRKKDLLRYKIRRILQGAAWVLLIAFVVIVLYWQVDIVRESVDAMIERFASEDGSYSGRTDLYLFAFTLFRGHYLKGIGWGQYRKKTTGFFGVADATYAAHNVYIQLLCETGILGLCAFLIAAVSALVFVVKKYRKMLHTGSTGPGKAVMELGCFLQVFFLAYCMHGNPLYDYNFCITYFMGILLTVITVPGRVSRASIHKGLLRLERL